MNVQEFLNINRVEAVYSETAVSKRICNEKGEPYLFKIKALSMEEFQRAKSRAVNGKGDLNTFKCSVVTAGCKEPNFKDAKSIKLLGVKTPEEYLRKVLLAGEISFLAGEILKLSGFEGLGENCGA
ncbi:MAG: hypothetical protein LUD81_01705 [Clostridiales bacterium]|nr:hypothetical protein [Clostridiales bacterium]